MIYTWTSNVKLSEIVVGDVFHKETLTYKKLLGSYNVVKNLGACGQNNEFYKIIHSQEVTKITETKSGKTVKIWSYSEEFNQDVMVTSGLKTTYLNGQQKYIK